MLVGIVCAVCGCDHQSLSTHGHQSVEQQLHAADQIVDDFGEVSSIKEIPRSEIERAKHAYEVVLKEEPRNGHALSKLVFLDCLEGDIPSAKNRLQLLSTANDPSALATAKRYFHQYSQSMPPSLAGVWVVWATFPQPKPHLERPGALLYNVSFAHDGTFTAHIESFVGLVASVRGDYKIVGGKVILDGQSRFHYDKGADETKAFHEDFVREGKMLKRVSSRKDPVGPMYLLREGDRPPVVSLHKSN
jgi:hypothetical protein